MEIRIMGNKPMNLNEKIGQLVMVGMDGFSVEEDARKIIEEDQVGGVILFRQNIENAEQLLRLTNKLKETNQKNPFPLFISVDEEGGRVSRMPKEMNKIPTNQIIGTANNPEFSFQIGKIIAQLIKAFGFNMNFAPVLDIHSNPNNPVIGDRSFGPNPEVVSRLGIQTMQGMQRKHILSVIKHFPGHGDTSVDSHVQLPVVHHDLERLKNVELLPFAEAIKNQADMIMTAHILLPQIDPLYPATLSTKIISNLLRKQLKFNGVVITDDMTMGAIEKNFDLEKAAVQAIQAGVDILLIANGYANAQTVLHALKGAVNKGLLTIGRVEESVHRIVTLKKKYNLSHQLVKGPFQVKELNDKITFLLNTYLNQ